MGREPRDHVKREIGALELRVGVDHDGNVNGVGNGAEVRFDLRVGDREIRLHDRENAVGAELLMRLCLATASAVDVEATPAMTGTRPFAASIVACTTVARCAWSR